MLAVVLATVFFAQGAPVITEVRVEQEGRTLDDRVINALIETTPDEPLSMRDVRDTLSHLTSLNRFEDVQVFQEGAGAGIRLRYVLYPLHSVDRMEFRGTLGLSEDEIGRVFTERFGAAPSAGHRSATKLVGLLKRARLMTTSAFTLCTRSSASTPMSSPSRS